MPVLDGGGNDYDTAALSPQGDLLWVSPGTGAPVALDRDGTLCTQPDPFNGDRAGLTALRP